MTEEKRKEEKPIMASWPQQKAIWAIMRRVCVGEPDKWRACNFDVVKESAKEGGRLTRKNADAILKAFYTNDFRLFRGCVWTDVCSGSTEQYDADKDKFEAAVRRPKKDPGRYTFWTTKEDRDKRDTKDKPAGGTRKEGGASFPDVGNRVVYHGTVYPFLVGHKGTVVEHYDSRNVGVDWDSFPGDRMGHDCGGKARDGHGWRVLKSEVRPDSEDWPDASEWEAKTKSSEDKESKDEPKKDGKEEAAKKTKRKAQKKYSPVTEGYEKPDIFDDVCLMIENGVQVLLVGPSGCGKSMMISEIQKVLGRDLYVESFAGGKRYAQVFGSTHLSSGESKWTQAEFLKAVQRPGIVFMDEVMSADPDVLIGCNSLLDKKTRCFHTPEGKVDVHPECVIVGASNVSGREYSQNYKGTQQQDASILNRFVHVQMTYDHRVERNIVDKSGIDKEDGDSILAWLDSLRVKVNVNNIMYDPSTRKLVQTIDMIKMGMKPSKAFKYAFINPLSELERKKIGDIC